jgi:hypothetical protein
MLLNYFTDPKNRNKMEIEPQTEAPVAESSEKKPWIEK